MSRSKATQKDWPGAMELTSLTKCAFTLSVATVFPESGNAAGETKAKLNSQYFTVRMGLCYPIGRPKTRGIGGLWGISQYGWHIPLRGRLS